MVPGMPGIQVLRLEKRSSVGGGLGKHIDGLTRPDTAAPREGLPAVELLDEHGKVITRENADRRRNKAVAYLEDCRKVRSRGPKPKPCVEFIVAGLSWDDPIERHRELLGAAAQHILRCGGPGVRIAHRALHLDEGQPHGHILVVVADEGGRLGWNRVRRGFGMSGNESGPRAEWERCRSATTARSGRSSAWRAARRGRRPSTSRSTAWPA